MTARCKKINNASAYILLVCDMNVRAYVYVDTTEFSPNMREIINVCII